MEKSTSKLPSFKRKINSDAGETPNNMEQQQGVSYFREVKSRTASIVATDPLDSSGASVLTSSRNADWEFQGDVL